jgi:hypothetical protein
MPAGEYSFTIDQGATFSKSFGVSQRNLDGTKTAINITGCTIRLVAKADYDDPLPIINLSTVDPPGGIQITNGAGGQFRVDMNRAMTAGFKFSQITHDTEMETPDGVVTPLLEGTITLKRRMLA